MSRPPLGCTTPACLEKVILNGDNASDILISLCGRLETLQVRETLPDLSKIITVLNAVENLSCLAQALYLDAVDYQGVEGTGRMLKFTPQEKVKFLDLCRQLNHSDS